MTEANELTLSQLSARIKAALHSPAFEGVWVVAETSDLRATGGHCYMELIEKDPANGAAVARMRATIWAGKFRALNDKFLAATGSPLASNLKVRVCVSVSYHPVYGLAANVTDIDPTYTLGDLLQRRQQILLRLQKEGILENNRRLPMPAVPNRIAVISAPGAAGYGDFINQLYTNRRCLRFTTRLFPALMQGQGAPASIIAALTAIMASGEEYDCVVLIRGGGATGDLAAFEDYALAANIAMFPLPVIIGIGHERDITLLDYVAHMRVKTPTAAAEWLIGRGTAALDRLHTLAGDILSAATAAMASAHRRLDTITGQLPLLVGGIIERRRRAVDEHIERELATCVANTLTRRRDRLKALQALLETISPEATLRRGFSITRIDGHAITDASQATPGVTLTTTLAHGTIQSTVQSQSTAQ